jgi:homoserine kinase
MELISMTWKRSLSRKQATLVVPSSSANVGLGFDIWCLGLKRPQLLVTYTKTDRKIEVETRSPCLPPSGRTLGYAGKLALEYFFREYDIAEGGHLLYRDTGYPVGGLGRSGAEAVGAIIAAAIVHGIQLSQNEVINLGAKGEPGEHKDNVAASTNGRFNVIAISPLTVNATVDVYNVPQKLGIAIGYSSYKKTRGTEGLRKILTEPVPAEDFIIQGGLISGATAALISGNIDRFLELVWGDRFHEPRRADVGGYGHFIARDFIELKRNLFEDYHIALNVSGAGPNMQFLYNKDEYVNGIVNCVSPLIVPWFKKRGVEMTIKPTEIASEGAYDYAKTNYNL